MEVDFIKYERDRKEFIQKIIDRYDNKVFRARVNQIIKETELPKKFAKVIHLN